MLPQQLGWTRSSYKHDHFLQTPESFIRAPLPGMTKATAVVHTAPSVGAGFAAYTAEMSEGGTLGPTAAQRFFFVLSGRIQLKGSGTGEIRYGFLPQGADHEIVALEETRLIVIEKPYRPQGQAFPDAFAGDWTQVEKKALMGDEGLLVQSLVPDEAAFDFAVNLLTFSPGASLPLVEMHVMEHGLFLLEGAGIYRLGESWYPVMAGDFIWMASYCPQWFAAVGKTPAKYLLYKDWNRHPL